MRYQVAKLWENPITVSCEWLRAAGFGYYCDTGCPYDPAVSGLLGTKQVTSLVPVIKERWCAGETISEADRESIDPDPEKTKSALEDWGQKGALIHTTEGYEIARGTSSTETLERG